ncbi:MAG: AMP-dependent synthetase/ligase, partial [bacterium]
MSLETLSQLFNFNVTQYNKPDLMIYRGHDGSIYKISTNEFKDRVINLALGLKELGVKPETKIILLSENRPEWHITDFACHLLSAVVVPIFPTLVAEQLEYIIQNSDSEFVVISNLVQANKIQPVRTNLKKIKNIIAMEEEAAKDDTIFFKKVLDLGSEQDDTAFFEDSIKLAKPDVIATIIYTSGTTGLPKGVMLSHQNIVSNFLACSKVIEINSSDRGLSFLPLSHAFGRTVDYLYFYKGLSIIYSNINNVAQDLQENKPTIMAAVPRFYEKVKSRIETKVEEEGGLKKRLFNWAVNVGRKKANLSLRGVSGGILLNVLFKIANNLVLSKIRLGTGGNIKYFISGGAPLSIEVAHFFYAIGLKI